MQQVTNLRYNDVAMGPHQSVKFASRCSEAIGKKELIEEVINE